MSPPVGYAWLARAAFFLFCATAAAQEVYTPADEAVAAISVEDARHAVLELVSINKHNVLVTGALWGAGPGFDDAFKNRVRSVTIDEERIVIEHGTGKISLNLEEIPKIRVMSGGGWRHAVVFGTDEAQTLWLVQPAKLAGSPREHMDPKAEAIGMANAVYAMHKFAMERKRQEADFSRIAGAYRAATSKPALSEEVRRLKLQAEFMIRDKRFSEAASLYDEALKGAPWWADGHYNRALVLAELKLYPQAIRQMKRYLLLEPESSNARAVQDQIYQWEAASAAAAR